MREIEDPSGRLHVDPPALPPFRRLFVGAPLGDLKVLIDMGGGPGLIGAQPAEGYGESQ